ncbi:unnamed protein product [Urochloa humidicola]
MPRWECACAGRALRSASSGSGPRALRRPGVGDEVRPASTHAAGGAGPSGEQATSGRWSRRGSLDPIQGSASCGDEHGPRRRKSAPRRLPKHVFFREVEKGEDQ